MIVIYSSNQFYNCNCFFKLSSFLFKVVTCGNAANETNYHSDEYAYATATATTSNIVIRVLVVTIGLVVEIVAVSIIVTLRV